jgi:cell division protein FtsZ
MSENTITAGDENVSQGKPTLTIIGVGGGGNSTVYRLLDSDIKGVNTVVANTDLRALSKHKGSCVIQLGKLVAGGRGAGANPAIGFVAAKESKDAIREAIKGSDMLFITAGFGGGTGTGAAPVIAEISKELGILTVAVVTKPFNFEGKKKLKFADEAINKMREHVDALLVVSNQKLLDTGSKGINMLNAFKKVDEVLGQAIRGLITLINATGHINVDFNDVRTVMSEQGLAVMGQGEVSGPERVSLATREAISNPLMEQESIRGAKGVLIHITGNSELSLDEVSEAGDLVCDIVDENALIVIGTTVDELMEDSVSVMVLATGIQPDIRPDSGNRSASNIVPLTNIRY